MSGMMMKVRQEGKRGDFTARNRNRSSRQTQHMEGPAQLKNALAYTRSTQAETGTGLGYLASGGSAEQGVAIVQRMGDNVVQRGGPNDKKPSGGSSTSGPTGASGGASQTGSANLDAFQREMEAARNANWQKNGSIWWPPNNGAVANTEHDTQLPAGTVVGRIGGTKGRYVAPPNTPREKLSLAPSSDSAPYTEYRLLKTVKVKEAIVAPWFDKPGGGTQYLLPDSIENMMKNNQLEMYTGIGMGGGNNA